QPTTGSISPEEGILRWCMRAPVCERAPAAITATPKSPSRAERVRVMSGERDLEGRSGGPDVGGTPIQGHSGRPGKSRNCERPREVGCILTFLQGVADVDRLVPRSVLDPQQADLAVGFEADAIARAKGEALQIGHRIEANDCAAQRIGLQIGF